MVFHCNAGQRAFGKCEWRKLNLASFVTQLNTERGTDYRLAECLDVRDSTRKQPEVRLVSPGVPDAVVEAKAVVWPPEYLRRHANEHTFCDTALRGLCDAFADGHYALYVDEENLGCPQGDALMAARAIAQSILAREAEAAAGRRIAGVTPFPWAFGRTGPPEGHGGLGPAPSGVGVTILGAPESDDANEILARHDRAVAGFRARLCAEMARAAPKFSGYQDCRRLFLAQFFGEDRDYTCDEDLLRVVAATCPPPEIDEVWVAYEDWVNEWDYELAWRRVR